MTHEEQLAAIAEVIIARFPFATRAAIAEICEEIFLALAPAMKAAQKA